MTAFDPTRSARGPNPSARIRVVEAVYLSTDWFTQESISRSIDASRSTVSRVLSEADRLGYVETRRLDTNTKGRPVVVYSLTDVGRTAINRVARAMTTVVFDGLPTDDWSAAVDAVSNVIQVDPSGGPVRIDRLSSYQKVLASVG